MSTIYRPLLAWTDLGIAEENRAALERVLNEWRGTPYDSGQALRQRGADCLGAVFGGIDDLDGRGRVRAPGFPQDSAMHNRAGAIAAMKEVLRRYAPIRRVGAVSGAPREVYPGDLVVTGASNGGPGHLMMVGARPNTLWHATLGPGFHQTGWALAQGQVLHSVWRPMEKHQWN